MKYSKILKIAIGSAIAMLIAYWIGLEYAVSAGVITLLTIQDTKKETVMVSIVRFIAFLMAAILAWIVFTVCAYNPVAYGLFLLLFVGIGYHFKMYEAIPINAVLATHYLLEKQMTLSLVGNEALLLLIGAGIGTLMNLYIPSNLKYILAGQRIIEEDIKNILSRMSQKLIVLDKSDYNDKCFGPLSEHIEVSLKHAYTNMNNSFFQETQYYIKYMEMRKQQCEVLREIYEKIIGLTTVPDQAYLVADFIKEISSSLAESNNAKKLIEEEEQLLARLKDTPLPITREEFEDRAILYMILKDFRIFLKMKESFAESLTEEQKRKYWETEVDKEKDMMH